MKKSIFVILILLIINDAINASIELSNLVSAPSSTITKLIQDGKENFDIEWALSPNTTRMSSNLSTIGFAGPNVPSTQFWVPINNTIAVSVVKLGSFLNPNGSALILTRTDIDPFKSVEVIPVNMSSNYYIMLLERAFDTSNCSSVYALLSTQFLGYAHLVVEISLINGSLLRQFDSSSLPIGLGLSNIWDIPSCENIFVMINGIGMIVLKRNSFELMGMYKPHDGIFPVNIVGGAALINTDTIVWSNMTKQTNLSELRIWQFVTEENSSSILLNNETLKDLELDSSFIGIDYNTGNIWTIFMSFGPGEYLATSVIYHYINSTKLIHQEIRWGEWLGWVEADHSQLGAIIINDSLIVVTMNKSNSVIIQKFIDNELYDSSKKNIQFLKLFFSILYTDSQF
jgi:hypothetical protein